MYALGDTKMITCLLILWTGPDLSHSENLSKCYSNSYPDDFSKQEGKHLVESFGNAKIVKSFIQKNLYVILNLLLMKQNYRLSSQKLNTSYSGYQT